MRGVGAADGRKKAKRKLGSFLLASRSLFTASAALCVTIDSCPGNIGQRIAGASAEQEAGLPVGAMDDLTFDFERTLEPAYQGGGGQVSTWFCRGVNQRCPDGSSPPAALARAGGLFRVSGVPVGISEGAVGSPVAPASSTGSGGSTAAGGGSARPLVRFTPAVGPDRRPASPSLLLPCTCSLLMAAVAEVALAAAAAGWGPTAPPSPATTA